MEQQDRDSIAHNIALAESASARGLKSRAA